MLIRQLLNHIARQDKRLGSISQRREIGLGIHQVKNQQDQKEGTKQETK